MNDFEVSIIDYLGKFETGILVLISITYQKKYYECTFFYTAEEMVLTISDELEEVVGDIKELPEYKEILLKILKKVIPFNEMWDRLDKVDFSKWVKGVLEVFEGEEAEILPDDTVKKLDNNHEETN